MLLYGGFLTQEKNLFLSKLSCVRCLIVQSGFDLLPAISSVFQSLIYLPVWGFFLVLVLFNPTKLLFENSMCNQDQCFTNIKKFCLELLLCAFITSSKKPISLVSLDLCFLQTCYQFITAFSSTCLHTDCSCFTNCSSYLSDIEVKFSGL